MSSVERAVRDALGVEVASARRLPSGSINDAFAVTLTDGRVVFVKTRDRPIEGLYAAEARGLAWLGEARALRVPEVLAATEACLVLEHLAPGRAARDHDERLGRGLAALHRFGADRFGGGHDNFLAVLPQCNDAASVAGWAAFYVERRLVPLAERAGRELSTSLRRDLDRLFARVPDLVGPAEPPARLHGDLWAGNAIVDEAGAPAIVDPAVYGGHREIDLAMMRLFGGFSSRVHEAYAEAFPLAPGAEDRVPLYQLAPLLAHAAMFGGGYAEQVAAVVREYA